MTFLTWAFSAALFLANAPRTVGEYPFEVKVTGTGQPMILIPGLACSGEVWDSTVARFKDRHACHVLTLAGFAGQPPMKDEGSYTDTIVKGIAAYIRDKKLEKPAIVGHSLGGFICFKLAAAEPDLVGSIIAVDGFPAAGLVFMPDATDADRKGFAAMFLKQYADAGKDEFPKLMRDFFGVMLSGEKLETAAKWAAASDQKSVVKALGEVFTGDARAGLEKVKSPVLLLGAYHENQKQYLQSKDVFEKRLAAQVEKVKGATVAVRDNCKHFIMYDAPDWMFEQMETVLGKK
jgi:pimeloyl-ACP methyl ester carboxylesterase